MRCWSRHHCLRLPSPGRHRHFVLETVTGGAVSKPVSHSIKPASKRRTHLLGHVERLISPWLSRVWLLLLLLLAQLSCWNRGSRGFPASRLSCGCSRCC